MITMTTCRIETCDKPVIARGWCNLHYRRWLHNGDPNKTQQAPTGSSKEERLRRKGWTVTSTGCWHWAGKTFVRGLPYGYITINSRPYLAHRAAYETWVGPIPRGLLVRHKCDNPPCINPDHLELGTNKDNSQDMVQRNRSCRKLSDEDVKKIRQLSAEGHSRVEVARLFNVAACTISQISTLKARV